MKSGLTTPGALSLLLLPLLLPGSAHGAEPVDAAAPPPWDAEVLAEAGAVVSETVVPGVPGDDGDPREGVSVRTTSFRILKTIDGQAPDGPLPIRFLNDATVHGSWGGKGWFVMWREEGIPSPAAPSHDGTR